MENFQKLTIERLKKLHCHKKQIAFAYSACIRLFPNYLYFNKKLNWGDSKVLLQSIDIIKEFILNNNILKYDIDILLLNIMKIIPDSDEFPTPISSYGQMAASAIYYTINNLKRMEIENLAWALVLARDTVDLFVKVELKLNVRENDFRNLIAQNFFMKRELQKQEEDYELLLISNDVSSRLLEKLTDFNNGKSNIDLR